MAARRWRVTTAAAARVAHGRRQILRFPSFENLLLLVRVMGPVVTNVVPNVSGQMVRLILHQADGSQHGHDQFLVLLLQTLFVQSADEFRFLVGTNSQ